MSLVALIPAAGAGARMGAPTPKQFMPLLGRPMLWHTLQALHAVAEIAQVYVVLSPADEWWDSYDWQVFDRLTVLRCGGTSRAESVLNGLMALQEAGVPESDWVLVHDAARPCIDPELVRNLIAELEDDGVGGLLAVPAADTLKRADDSNRIVETVPRDGIWQAQTPQMFHLGPLLSALTSGFGPDITDEASAMEKAGAAPLLVLGSPWNLKVTYAQDVQLAELVLAGRATL